VPSPARSTMDTEAALRDRLTKALHENKRLTEAKNQAEETARSSQAAMQRMQRLHAQEIADAQVVANTLREEIALLKALDQDKHKLYERNLANLRAARDELEVSASARETYAAEGAKILRRDVAKASDEVEGKQNRLALTEDKLYTVTKHLDRVYHEYSDASRMADRATNQSEQAEHLRQLEALENQKFWSAMRFEKHQRCAAIQQEKVEAVHHMRESLSSAYGNLMKATREKVEAASVLGVVCDESREILQARNKYYNESENLRKETSSQRQRLMSLEELTGKREKELDTRNEELRKTKTELNNLAGEASYLRGSLATRQELLDDVHFALTPMRISPRTAVAN